jgi:hypothetical protein
MLPEPGRPGHTNRRSAVVPRFVILAHDWPTPHFDLLLEHGPVLRAWRLLGEPAAGVAVEAEANHDHRLMYLDYEGPVSGSRGSVSRWDAGVYDGNVSEPAWRVRLNGLRLCGSASLGDAEGRLVFRFDGPPETGLT